MEEKQEDRSKQAHIKHTDKGQSIQHCIKEDKREELPAVCTVWSLLSHFANSLKSEWEWECSARSGLKIFIYTTTELRTQTLLGMDLEPSDRFWTYIQYIETGARREEEGRGEVGKKDLFLFQRSCQVDLQSASEWCVMCRRAFFLLIPSTLVERIGLRDE